MDEVKLARRIQLFHLLFTLCFDAFMAWQIAKAICPPLAVQEQMAIDKVKRIFKKRQPHITQGQVIDFIAEVTKFVRDQENNGPQEP